MNQTGTIVFYTGVFGFILLDNSQESVFFHKSSLSTGHIFKTLDRVNVKFKVLSKGKHEGLFSAEIVELSETRDFNRHEFHVGQITEFKRGHGFITSPEFEKKVILYESRNLFSDKFKKGDWVVFDAVKSSKNPKDLFAPYAYRFDNEDRAEWIRDKIIELHSTNFQNAFIQKKHQSNDELFLKEVMVFMQTDFQSLKDSAQNLYEIIKRFPDLQNDWLIDILSTFEVSESIQIYLWEKHKAFLPKVDLLERYFLRTSLNQKFEIFTGLLDVKSDLPLQLVSSWSKDVNLHPSYRRLRDFLSFADKLNPQGIDDIKGPNANTIRRLLNKDLFYNEDGLKLWIRGYLSDLPSTIISKYLDLDDYELLLNDTNGLNEENWIQLLQILGMKLKKEIESKNWENPISTKNHLILVTEIVKLFESSFPNKKAFDYLELNFKNIEQILPYIKLESIPDSFTWEKYSELEKARIIHSLGKDYKYDILPDLNIEKLEKEIIYHEWPELSGPERLVVNEDINIPGLFDKLLNLEWLIPEITKIVTQLSIACMNSEDFPMAWKVRMWIYRPLIELDYLSISSGLEKLTKHERNIVKAKYYNEEDFNTNLKYQDLVLPAKFIGIKDRLRIYSCQINNFYFRAGNIYLKLAEDQWSESFSADYSNTGLNEISELLYDDEITAIVDYRSKTIKELEGLEGLIEKIRINTLEGILGKNLMEFRKSESKATIENISLRQSILDYLNRNQDPNFEIITLIEQQSRKQVDPNKTREDDFIKNGTLSNLFTIKSSTDYLIVWEVIDLTIHEKATYLFKGKSGEVEKLHNRLTGAITSFLHLRSTLYGANSKLSALGIKEYFGYVGRITKDRGTNNAFQVWLEKLQSLGQRQTSTLSDIDPLPELAKEKNSLKPGISQSNQKSRKPKPPKPTTGVRTVNLESIGHKEIESNETWSDLIKNLQGLNGRLEKLLSNGPNSRI